MENVHDLGSDDFKLLEMISNRTNHMMDSRTPARQQQRLTNGNTEKTLSQSNQRLNSVSNVKNIKNILGYNPLWVNRRGKIQSEWTGHKQTFKG